MSISNIQFPWSRGSPFRPYTDSAERLSSIAGGEDGVIYERSRSGNLKTSIVCQGRGLRWQASSAPFQGFYEAIAMGDSIILTMAHMLPSTPLTVARYKDSYVYIGINVDGKTLGMPVSNLEGNVAHIGAVYQSAMDTETLPPDEYACSVTMLLPLDKATEMLGSTWPVIQSEVNKELKAAYEKGKSQSIRSASQASLRFVTEMLQCSYEGDIRFQYMQAKLQELLCHLSEMFKHTEPVSGYSRLQYQAILVARDILNTNITTQLTNAELADKVGISETKLLSGFQAVYGKSPYQLVLEERMKRAEKLLSDTDLEIDKIASQLGYCSSSSFIRAFKQRYGVTPRNYRCR